MKLLKKEPVIHRRLCAKRSMKTKQSGNGNSVTEINFKNMALIKDEKFIKNLLHIPTNTVINVCTCKRYTMHNRKPWESNKANKGVRLMMNFCQQSVLFTQFSNFFFHLRKSFSNFFLLLICIINFFFFVVLSIKIASFSVLLAVLIESWFPKILQKYKPELLSLILYLKKYTENHVTTILFGENISFNFSFVYKKALCPKTKTFKNNNKTNLIIIAIFSTLNYTIIYACK